MKPTKNKHNGGGRDTALYQVGKLILDIKTKMLYNVDIVKLIIGEKNNGKEK